MFRAWQVFLFLNLIRDKVNFIVASPSNLSLVQDGFYILPQSREAAEGEGKVEVALTSTRCSTLVGLPAAEDPRYTQQASFERSPFSTSTPCSFPSHHGSKTTIVAMCDMSCGDERDVPSVLEMWSRMGQLLRPILHSTRSPQPVVQSAIWQTTSLGWTAMGWSPIKFLESTLPHQALCQSRPEKQQRQQFMARWRSPTSWKRTWQRARAKFWTGSDGTLFALPEHDASVSTAHDAASLTTTYDRQGCWKRSCTAASHDATEHIGSCSSNNALGTIGTNDADADSPNMLIYDARASHDLSSRWTSSTKAESTSQRDEEGRGQLTSTSPIHSPRDAETRPEEQHQNALPSSASVGRCEARSARGRK